MRMNKNKKRMTGLLLSAVMLLGIAIPSIPAKADNLELAKYAKKFTVAK